MVRLAAVVEANMGLVAKCPRHGEAPNTPELSLGERRAAPTHRSTRGIAFPRDLDLAREDAAAYLARDDAALKERVRRALEAADRE